jgi:hypothetical protein
VDADADTGASMDAGADDAAADADAAGGTLGVCEQGPTARVKSAAPSLILL